MHRALTRLSWSVEPSIHEAIVPFHDGYCVYCGGAAYFYATQNYRVTGNPRVAIHKSFSTNPVAPVDARFAGCN
jgi:hypothetical protein